MCLWNNIINPGDIYIYSFPIPLHNSKVFFISFIHTLIIKISLWYDCFPESKFLRGLRHSTFLQNTRTEPPSALGQILPQSWGLWLHRTHAVHTDRAGDRCISRAQGVRQDTGTGPKSNPQGSWSYSSTTSILYSNTPISPRFPVSVTSDGLLRLLVLSACRGNGPPKIISVIR